MTPPRSAFVTPGERHAEAGAPEDADGPTLGWSVHDGLAVLGPQATALVRTLDDTFAAWGRTAGAAELTLPPLTRADALAPLDYFSSFPHLGSAVTRIRPDHLAGYPAATAVAAVPATDLADATHLLPSAACYGVYLHLRGRAVPAPTLVTTVAQCFRNEDRHDGLRRLWGFTMREIVCIGTADDVRAHLGRHHDLLTGFLGRLGVTLDRAPATDPFFRRDDPKAFLQRLDPVKEEYVFADGTAAASTNQHRNFFGERCGITVEGRPAFTGCVAFGLERWLHVLGTVFRGDLDAAREAVLAAGGPG